MKVSITEAAKLAGISRAHLYRAYIKSGKISLSTTEQGKSVIDTSELLRVFNMLQGGDTVTTEEIIMRQPMLQPVTSEEAVLKERVKGLEVLLKAREEELEGYRYREKTFYHLLEDKTPKKHNRWWPFK